jgi:hypothetical protein
MQGLIENQTSGNDWSQSGQPDITRMLHEDEQEIGRFPRRPADHGKFFVKLEDQMERFGQAQVDAVRQIEAFYTIRNGAEVKEFLESHKLVTQVLAEAIDHLKKHFEGCMFSLRLKTDEYDDQMLYAAAAWKKEPKKVVSALNAFDDEWWLANSYPAGRHLSFTYDLG